MTTDIRITKLQNLYKRDKNAKKVLDWCSQRLNNSGETSLDRCAQVVQIEREELVEVFRSLENCGVGKFIIGRRGAPTRFQWSVGLVSAGHVAQGSASNLISWPVAEPEDNEISLSNELMRQGQGHKITANGVTITLSRAQVREIVESLQTA